MSVVIARTKSGERVGTDTQVGAGSIRPNDGTWCIAAGEGNGNGTITRVRTTRAAVRHGQHFAITIGDGHCLLNGTAVRIDHGNGVHTTTQIGHGQNILSNDASGRIAPRDGVGRGATCDHHRGSADANGTLALCYGKRKCEGCRFSDRIGEVHRATASITDGGHIGACAQARCASGTLPVGRYRSPGNSVRSYPSGRCQENGTVARACTGDVAHYGIVHDRCRTRDEHIMIDAAIVGVGNGYGNHTCTKAGSLWRALPTTRRR